MEGVVPESVIEAVNKTSNNFEEFRTRFADFLVSFCEPDLVSELDLLHRAQALHLLAKAATTLFALKLRCNGVDPEDHPVKSELERLNFYHEKLDQCLVLSQAPLRPSTTLNYQAATRFIEHSLPDLTYEQKKSMRDISRGERVMSAHSEGNVNKRRKYQSVEKKSARTAAQEFLEKAAQELLGDDHAFKGPLQPQDSD